MPVTPDLLAELLAALTGLIAAIERMVQVILTLAST